MSLRSGDEIQEALRSFIGRWGNYAGTERSEAQTFLNELFAAYGADRKQVARFEDPQGSGGIVDCLYPGVAVIEMKRPARPIVLPGTAPRRSSTVITPTTLQPVLPRRAWGLVTSQSIRTGPDWAQRERP